MSINNNDNAAQIQPIQQVVEYASCFLNPDFNGGTKVSLSGRVVGRFTDGEFKAYDASESYAFRTEIKMYQGGNTHKNVSSFVTKLFSFMRCLDMPKLGKCDLPQILEGLHAGFMDYKESGKKTRVLQVHRVNPAKQWEDSKNGISRTFYWVNGVYLKPEAYDDLNPQGPQQMEMFS